MDRDPVPLREALADTTARLVWLDGFDCGEHVGRLAGYLRGWRAAYAAGHAAGRAECAAEADEADREHHGAHARELVRWLVSRPSYADLAALRGQPERAARARELLAERGVSR